MHWSDMQMTATGQPESVTVTAATRAGLLADLDARLRRGQGFSVATLNLDHVVKLRRLPAFRAAYLRQTHVTADGNPIVWLSKLAGQPVELVPGSELIAPLAELAEQHDVPVALFGSTEAALEAAARGLTDLCPRLRIVARIAPPMGFDPGGAGADDSIRQIAASGARLCFLALGAPKQEIFAAHAQDQLPQVGFLSIGAGLDFIAGSQVRAPRIVRALAAEWLWRLAHDPGRLAGRYAACIAVLPGLVGRALRSRQTPSRSEV